MASAITDQARGTWVDPQAGKLPLRRYSTEWMHAKPSLSPETVEQGTPLRQSNVRNRHWYPTLKATGVEKLRFHDPRHLAGTLATVSGATIREVQARLGHASPPAAYRYQHVLESRDAEIAERLNVYFRTAPADGSAAADQVLRTRTTAMYCSASPTR